MNSLALYLRSLCVCGSLGTVLLRIAARQLGLLPSRAEIRPGRETAGIIPIRVIVSVLLRPSEVIQLQVVVNVA